MSATTTTLAAAPLLPPGAGRAAAGVLALCLLLSFAALAAQLAMPLLTMHVLDGVLVSRNADTLTALALAYAAAVLLGAALRHLRAALLAALAERVARRLHLRGLEAALRRSLADGGERSAGLAALGDVAELRRALGGSVAADLFDLAAMPAMLAVLFLLHPLYGWVALGGCLLVAALGAVADATTRGLVRAAGAAGLAASAGLAGRMRQPDLLDGLGMRRAVMRRWRAGQARALAEGDAAQARARALQGLASLAGQGLQMAVVATGAWLVVRQAATPGSILAAALLTGMAAAPVGRLVATWRDWAFAAAALRRLRALIAGTVPPPAAAPDPEAPAGLLVEGLACQPVGAPAPLVRDLSLHLPPGEAMLVLGPNGAGKSTLLRALLGLAPAAAGRALLDGADLGQAAGRAALGPRIGYLPQGGQLLAGTVMENIARFTARPPAEAVAAARRAGAHEAIGRLPEGYATAAGPAAPLSGGQRQRVALARALFGAPRLLALDEPEAGLDAPAMEALRGAVAAAKAEGACVVVVTHDPGHWAGVADRALRLRPGGAWSIERMETA